jgi:hypothetical protein
LATHGGNAENLDIARGNLHEIFFIGGIAKLANIAGGISLLTPKKIVPILGNVTSHV